MKIGSRLFGALTLLGTVFSALPLVAQNAACQLHDQMCIYHGIGRQMGYDPSGPTSITASANWDQPNDADLHALLPTGNIYSAPTEALPGYPIQLSEPFYPDVSGAHIYPNHYESQINGGAATATHSGDAGGGLAPYPGQPGCDPSIQSSVTCEAITVQGDVPSGVYSYAIHAFPASGSSFPLTNFTLGVEASGNMVLVVDDPSVINPVTGLVQQVGSFQGSAATTSQLDVYALNVGHAGHVGGVTIPQMELVSLSDGTQRYQPVEPLLFDETPSIQDQIAGAFLLRDQQVAYYEGLREQEKQRLAYLAELARARAAYNKWLVDQEKAQAQQAKMVYMDCPAPLMSCVPSYVKGEKFTLTQPSLPIVNNSFAVSTLYSGAGSLLYQNTNTNNVESATSLYFTYANGTSYPQLGSNPSVTDKLKYSALYTKGVFEYAIDHKESWPSIYWSGEGGSIGTSGGTQFAFNPWIGELYVSVGGGAAVSQNYSGSFGVTTNLPNEGYSTRTEAGLSIERGAKIEAGLYSELSKSSKEFGGYVAVPINPLVSVESSFSNKGTSIGVTSGAGFDFFGTELYYTKLFDLY